MYTLENFSVWEPIKVNDLIYIQYNIKDSYISPYILLGRDMSTKDKLILPEFDENVLDISKNIVYKIQTKHKIRNLFWSNTGTIYPCGINTTFVETSEQLSKLTPLNTIGNVEFCWFPLNELDLNVSVDKYIKDAIITSIRKIIDKLEMELSCITYKEDSFKIEKKYNVAIANFLRIIEKAGC